MLPHTDYVIFVYGTLRPGGRYYRQLCQGKGLIILPAYTRGQLFHLNLGYPALASGDGWVRGDLLCFSDDPLMRALDQLEDYDPNLPDEANAYLRHKAPVYDLHYQMLGYAERYEMSPSLIETHGGLLVSDGDWAEETIHDKLRGG